MITLFRRLYPDEMLESAYVIDYDRLREEGFRGMVCDIDNTLVPHGAPPDNRATALFAHLHVIGIQAVFVSNNGEPRVRRFNDIVQEQYICMAHKPSPDAYRKAMDMMGTDTSDTFFVGDQIFTDILGAKRAGIHAILVKPIHPREEIQIILKRQLERPILCEYRRWLREDGTRLKASRASALRPADGKIPELYGPYSGKSGTMHQMQD
jgi:HAD superfamily phosphatase (TIGR01668 family)